MKLTLVLTPALLLGVNVGLIANQMSPGWIISLAIIIVLTYMAVRTLKSAIRLRAAEKRVQCDASSVVQSVELPCTKEKSVINANGRGTGTAAVMPGLRKQSLTVPWNDLGKLFLLWIAFAGLQIVKSMLKRCSWAYGVIYLSQILLTFLCTLFFVHCSVRVQPERGIGHEVADAEEVLLESRSVHQVEVYMGDQEFTEQSRESVAVTEWGYEKLFFVAACAAGAGVVAGLIGLGG